MEKYVKDGNVAILISPGYGAGWSTWNQQELSYDKRVVEYFLSHDNPTDDQLKEDFEAMGYKNVYFGGYDDLEIKWVQQGQRYFIEEVDGFETVRYPEHYRWLTA